jgi:molybdenum cofactor synthesis domain-containing protein
MLVIGDEILSGRTRDANMHHLAGRLSEVGIDLKEARVIGDDRDTIIETVRALSSRYEHVFTSGGIGPTHDDITAEAVAQAMGAPISIRDDARAILQAHYDARGQDLTEARLRMARIPQAAELIENPVSAAPGFTLGNVHVMAGVPNIFSAMLESLLPRLSGGTPLTTVSIRVNMGEGDLAGRLTDIADAFPDIALGSYPFVQDGIHGANIVMRATDALRLAEAEARLREAFGGAVA